MRRRAAGNRVSLMIQHWTEHVCVGCGGAYRYTTQRTKSRHQRSKPRVKMRPCPSCGLYQPDMVGAQRAQFHLAVGLGSAAVAGSIGLAAWLGDFPEWRTTLVAAGVAVLALPVQLIVLFWNPNRNPDAGCLRAKQLIRQRVLERLRGETADLAKEELPRPRFGALTVVAIFGIALGIWQFLSAELVRRVYGWPLNADWYPAVVGPGDEARFYFPERVDSLQGLWDGRAEAELLNAQEVGVVQRRLSTDTGHARWGNELHFKNDERRRAPHPWVLVYVPDSPELSGKDLRVKLDLVATYPADHGAHFIEEQRNFTATPVIRLADRPGAGAVYAALCRGGTLGGALWLLLMSLVLALAAWSFRREAFPVKGFAEREDEDDDDDRPERIRRRRIRDD
jgi:hypothetical protein